MNKWEKILTPLDKNKRFWTICVGISCAILIVATGIGTWNVNEGNILLVNYICDIVISLSTAILGTFALNIIYNLSEIHKVSTIFSVSYESLLPDLLSALERFEGRYRKDESVSIKIRKYDKPEKVDFYKIVIEYQYITNISNLRKLEFKFYRMLEDSIDKFTGGLNDNHIICDFTWGVDERKFKTGIIQNSDYKISQLVIGGDAITNIEQYKVELESGKNKIISYSIPIESLNNLNVGAPVQLSYRVILPLEKEDILLITHELPTQNAKISFDYSDLGDEINVYGMPLTGTISPLKPEDEEEDDYRITYLISGWILPKQGYVFGWWKC